VLLIQGDQTRQFSALCLGVINLAAGSNTNWSPKFKEFNLLSLPVLMTNYAAIDALTNGDVGEKILAMLDKSGAVDAQENLWFLFIVLKIHNACDDLQKFRTMIGKF
jgi:TRAP-type C4-dicarboxylate transport system substrate-binding protein